WELYQRAMERVTSLGGIESASYGRMKPFYSFSFMRIRIQGQDEAAGDSPTAFSDVVDTSYFRTLRIPVRAGRTFTLADREGAERVVVINEAMANAYWPGRNPVGECFIVEADCLR